MAMFGSGVLIAGMTVMNERLLMAVHGFIMIIILFCCAVVLGTTILGTAVRRIATTSSVRAAGTTTLVFVLCVLLRGLLSP
jgi:hypothetical protein